MTLGLLLLAAAGLKLTAGDTSAISQNAVQFSPAVQMLAVEVELLLGFWLLSGQSPRPARLAALAFFVVMAGISLRLALQGQSSCGCFGRLTVHPWATLTLDIVAALALALARPISAKSTPLAPVLGVIAKVGGGGVVLLTIAALGVMAVTGESVGGLLALARGEPIAVQPAATDLGFGVEGEVRQFDVLLVNRTNREVRVIGGSSSCSCLATKALPLVIPARSEVAIPIRAVFAGTPGAFIHEFVFYTDDDSQTQVAGRFVGSVAGP